MQPIKLRSQLPLLSDAAIILSPDLAMVRKDEQIVLFNASGPIYQCKEDDSVAVRLGAVLAIDLGLAGVGVVGDALGLHRGTLHRVRTKYAAGGVEALRERKRGPKGPHKLTPAALGRAQRVLDSGGSQRAAAERADVSEFAIRHSVKRGLLRRAHAGESRRERPATSEVLTGPRDRATVDQTCSAGVATKRELDRVLASTGKLAEAEPEFEAAEAVAGAGVLLALPALLHEGLCDVGIEVYGSLRNGFFGLRSVLLTFAFMALLRIKTPEQLTEHAPGELGILLGLDRAPEVKTLRRKLRELGGRRVADMFTRRLTERWAEAEPKELALLYVDGHVRPYHGRKHTLPKHYVQQRGRPMPGTKDFHVNDRRADPLFFVTAEATEGMLSMLESTLLPEVRRQVGPNRRVTIVFDREGWSPEKFAKWKAQGFDVLTYRKGVQSRWQKRFFQQVQGKVGGEEVDYQLAEREVKLTNGLKVREIRRLTDDNHQTAVITTSNKLPLLAVAHRMFSRWRQENFFRYMRHEFALDHRCTHHVEPADPKRSVPHPERARLEKKLRSVRVARMKLLERVLHLAPGQTTRVGKRNVGEEELDQLILEHETEARKLSARIGKLPKRVPVEEVLEPQQIIQLERERKVFVDAIKLTAYRAESSLARLVDPFFQRHQQEARKLLKSIFRASADVIPDRPNRQLTVRFHGLANPRSNRALAELCALANDNAPCFPGSDLRLHFEPPPLQK